MGIGSELRADDFAGVVAAEQIAKISKKILYPQIEIFIGGTVPENITSQIKRFEPSHLLVIDAADIKAQPGQMAIIEQDQITGSTFSTHSLSIKIMADYLLFSLPDLKIVFVGIQPKDISLGREISAEVSKGIKELVSTIENMLKK